MRLCVFLAVCSTAYSQSYTAATIAGGAPRPLVHSAAMSIGAPSGIGVDGAGNIYFASQNCIFKVDPSGGLTRVAGNYAAGYQGDGGPATDALIHQPVSIAVDSAGDIYIPDRVSWRIRKVSPNGIITTIAGTGIIGTPNPGDGGPATQAFLGDPDYVALDRSGNLYVSQQAVGKVARISPAGIFQTVAGGGNFNQTGDGGPAVGAFINGPDGLAVDGAGNLFIAEPNNNRIRRVSPDGIITTVAGAGSGTDLVFDSAGNLYIGSATANTVERFSPAGTLTTVAGTGLWGYAGDGGPAAAAAVSPRGMAFDAAGNLLLADGGSNRIRKIVPGGMITSVAGDGGFDYSGDGGPALNARLSLPGAMAVDDAGNLYIADRGNNRVRKIDSAGIITTFAGSGNPGSAGDGGQATAAEVMPTGGIAWGAGSLYINTPVGVRKVARDGTIQTVLVTGSTTLTSSPLTAETASISGNIAVDGAGDIFIAIPSSGIAKFTPDGTRTQLTTNTTQSFAVDAAGDLYYFDLSNVLIDRLDTGGNLTDGIVNFGAGCGPGSGIGSIPGGLALDRNGIVFLTDPSRGGIWRATPTGLDRVAGTGLNGYSGDGGPAAYAQFNQPHDLAMDAAGNIYVSDPTDAVVRVLKPAPATVPVIGAVTNAASSAAGPIAPGEIAVIYGAGLGAVSVNSCPAGAAAMTDTTFDETQVLFNGVAAPLLYTSSTQVSAMVPKSLPGSSVQVTVVYQGRTSAAVSVPVAAVAPALFAADGSGRGQAAAVNQDGSTNGIVGQAFPVNRGEFLSLYATGAEQAPAASVTVTIAGETVQPEYAGPSFFPGLTQINFRIPLDIRPGTAIPVSIQADGASSQPGITIAVGEN